MTMRNFMKQHIIVQIFENIRILVKDIHLINELQT